MLATDADLGNLRYPLLASAKLDGIRAIVINGVVMSRTLKPIPNKFVQQTFRHFEHYDGELIVGEPTAKTVYRDTVSHVMSHDKRDFDVRFYAFDHVSDLSDPYHTRANRLQDHPDVPILPQQPIKSLDHLRTVEDDMLEQGYEGLILRDESAPYKCGRSTAKQGWLLKLKRFVDAEATVIGFEERMHNGNAATVDALGHTKRSTHQANKTGLGDLGALVCSFGSYTVNIGTGFDAAERKTIWDNRESYIGKLAKFKYFDYGVKDAPRHPVFLGWRSKLDV
jgi:DNA ligase 1